MLSNLILDIEIFTLLDVFFIMINKPLKYYPLAALIVAVAVHLLGVKLKGFNPDARFKTAGIILCASAIIGAGLVLGMNLYGKSLTYKNEEVGKEKAFSNKSVMLIVPHPDDDINVLGGVTEEFIKYSSDVRVVFVTNGDAWEGLGEKRINEALSVYRKLNLPEENVIFLGYGDSWGAGNPHIYNTGGMGVRKSIAGRTATYGTAEHSAYNDGHETTYENLLSDMKGVIAEYRPDIIFCSDYDHQEAHRAASMFFEKALGELLKETPDYRPCVFKGYAYLTAYYSEPDFFGDNLKSTLNTLTGAPEEIYEWSERTRLPVDTSALSRSLLQTRLYKELRAHASQVIFEHSERIINSDKVFWQRDTNSLCYSAKIDVSSNEENKSVLNDFMILDNKDLLNSKHYPYDNVWSPEKDDAEKSFSVKLNKKADVYSVALYDNPSPQDNILNAVISFDDGTTVKTGALKKNGAKTEIIVNKKDVSRFSIKITDAEGEDYGISELEARSEKAETPFEYIKLEDKDGNFAYDYYTDKSGKVQFNVFNNTNSETAEYSLTCDNDKCSAEIENSTVTVYCPYKEHCRLTVTDGVTGLSDEIYLSNPSRLRRKNINILQSLEKTSVTAVRKLALYKLMVKILGLIYYG